MKIFKDSLQNTLALLSAQMLMLTREVMRGLEVKKICWSFPWTFYPRHVPNIDSRVADQLHLSDQSTTLIGSLLVSNWLIMHHLHFIEHMFLEEIIPPTNEQYITHTSLVTQLVLCIFNREESKGNTWWWIDWRLSINSWHFDTIPVCLFCRHHAKKSTPCLQILLDDDIGNYDGSEYCALA